ncbi:MAG: polyphosphate kinase 2 family protein [Caldilineaceae bacterium]
MGKSDRFDPSTYNWQAVDVAKYQVRPDSKVKLADWDPNDKSLFDGIDKQSAAVLLDAMNDRLEELQELLFAEGKHKVLIVLQAMDTGGKDGTIRAVFEGVNPTGVRVASFKAPTGVELAHDYLWRIHQQVPAKGEMVIFNRSHYEDVLVVRVEGFAPEPVWKRRFGHINDFERMLVDEGTTILKFYLHIDLEEQKERLQARLDDPSKHWKFAIGDLETRKKWPLYMEAFEEVFSKTSSKDAPWMIVPANRKWYRNLVICKAILDALEGLHMSFPPAEAGLEQVVIE